ncbi:MAG TPA: NAD+ synthase [Nitrososphaeraceae archaeon]|nr:NAD+ synthase [Nitrososphaeraceae archaeon]
MSHDILSLNYEKIVYQITKFISEQVKSRKKNGVVIGLSGGLDSSVCLVLACKALGNNRIFGLIMPERGQTPQKDINNAYDLAHKLKIKHKEIHFERAKKILLSNLPNDKLSGGNLSARLRMAFLYHFAGKSNLLVLGTSDKSELMIGYFTKFGDGGADILPLGGLYKSQVKILGKKLGLSEHIINQPSSPRFWKGHVAEKELGLAYHEIDTILQYYLENNMASCNLSKKKKKLVTDMVRKSQHKRELIPVYNPL